MKNTLITGGSGFLGQYLLQEYQKQNGEIITVGRDSKNTIVCDLSKNIPSIGVEEFDQVVFAAGKAHFVPKTEAEKKSFFDVNLEGLKNLLKGLDGKKIHQFILVSTVAVYGCESGIDIAEDAPLLAKDPYGLSKIQAEKWLTQWCAEREIPVLIFRLPLVAGKNPLGNLGAMVHGLKSGKYPKIGRGLAQKSIVLAEDVARLFVAIPRDLSGIYNLTDDVNPTFSEIENHVASQLNVTNIPKIPLFVAHFFAFVGNFLGGNFPINSNRLSKILSTLTFSSKKAKEELPWKPRKVTETTYLS
jgi:nucleoside-diphosphate-sugar epimerase